MTKPYIVRVPVTIEAESPEAALAAAEKQYGTRPKKATEAPAAAYPPALRAHVVKSGLLNVGINHTVRWCDVDGVRWLTNSYLAVVIDPDTRFVQDPFPGIATVVRAVKIGTAQPLKRFRLHAEIGEAFLDIRLVNFIEAIYPACEWSPTGGGLDPIAALVGKRLVGLAMPVRERLTVADAYKRLRDARWELESNEKLVALAPEIRVAVKRVDAAEKRATLAQTKVITLRHLANQAKALDGAEERVAKAKADVAATEAELRAMGEKV